MGRFLRFATGYRLHCAMYTSMLIHKDIKAGHVLVISRR